MVSQVLLGTSTYGTRYKVPLRYVVDFKSGGCRRLKREHTAGVPTSVGVARFTGVVSLLLLLYHCCC